MTKETTALDFTGQVFNVGLDVHLRSWTNSVRSTGVALEGFRSAPDPQNLVKHMKRRYPGGTYVFGYEAGLCGFWIQRQFQQLGCECVVANPADVPTTDKERQAKTDPRDAAKIARELENQTISAIYVPCEQIERLRQLCRLRERLVSHSTRLKQRIKGYLALDGIKLPSNATCSHWSANFLQWVDDCVESSGRPECLVITLDELRQQRPRITETTRSLRALLKLVDRDHIVGFLRTVPGIGFIAAVTLFTELADIHRFPKFDNLASFAGLVCGSRSSGENERHTGLTNRRNRYIRHILIESAWVAIRKDPDLFHTYSNACKRMKKARAIVPVARRLLKRIRCVWREQRPYRLEMNTKNEAKRQ